jgi:hypothetical protein
MAFKDAKQDAQEQNIPFPYKNFEELKKGDHATASSAWWWAELDASRPDCDWLELYDEGLEKDAENAKRKRIKDARRRQAEIVKCKEQESLCFFVQERNDMCRWERVVWRGKRVGCVVAYILGARTD